MVLLVGFDIIGLYQDLLTSDRWHVYDTITNLIYGKPVGMVETGSDVNDLIKEWHRMFPMGRLLASLLWLIHLILSNSILRPLLMPSKAHGVGSGHIMLVSFILERRLRSVRITDQAFVKVT